MSPLPGGVPLPQEPRADDVMEKGEMFAAWLGLQFAEAAPGSIATLPVLSGSMAPDLLPGLLVRIKAVPWRDCRAGDIIVFREGTRLTAHRLLCRIRLGRRTLFFQKGDANRLGTWIQGERVVGIVSEKQAADGKWVELSARPMRRRSRRKALSHLMRCLFSRCLGPARWTRRWMRRWLKRGMAL